MWDKSFSLIFQGFHCFSFCIRTLQSYNYILYNQLTTSVIKSATNLNCDLTPEEKCAC